MAFPSIAIIIAVGLGVSEICIHMHMQVLIGGKMFHLKNSMKGESISGVPALPTL